VQHTDAHQPITRLWLQSMTPAAIREAFAALRSDGEMQPLADAARCRSEADWLVGINGTRAMTAFQQPRRRILLTTVGRVQTPTLTIVVEREEQIRKSSLAITGKCGPISTARPAPTKGAGSIRPSSATNRIGGARRAACGRGAGARHRGACAGQPGKVSEESKPSTQLSPLLFDLTVAATGGQLAVRLLGQDDAIAGTGAVRAAQGADLSEDRLARAARGLHGRRVKTMQMLAGKEPARGPPKNRVEAPCAAAVCAARAALLKEGWVKPTAESSTTPRSRTTSRSFRRCRSRVI